MRLHVIEAGMVTPVGYGAATSAAAIRCGIDTFQSTGFMLDGKWLLGAQVAVPEEGDATGLAKLLWMAAQAADECLAHVPARGDGDVAIALCVAERERHGRSPLLDDRFLVNLCARLRAGGRLGRHRALFSKGSVGGAEALQWADGILARGNARHVVLVGVDSYLNAPTIAAYHRLRRLVTATNSDGFLPGEAAAAILLVGEPVAPVTLECLGVGWGQEDALQDSGKPLRGDGLTTAYRAAFESARCGYPEVDYRIADIGGDQYAFKEASLALLRTIRVRKEAFYLWHPADCVGRVGAASVPLALGIALAAARRSYAPGPGALCHFTDDSGARAAVVVRQRGTAAAMGHEGWVRG